MAKLGSKKRPLILRVKTEVRAKELFEICQQNDWQCIIGLETDKPENIADLEAMLHKREPLASDKTGRNDPSPCGSSLKFKKCCGA
jgi:SWIM/SEC-C metal-binding protein